MTTLPEIFNTLHSAGFITTVNEANTAVTVSLKRPISTFEVWVALNKEIAQSRISRVNANTVAISE